MNYDTFRSNVELSILKFDTSNLIDKGIKGVLDSRKVAGIYRSLSRFDRDQKSKELYLKQVEIWRPLPLRPIIGCHLGTFEWSSPHLYAIDSRFHPPPPNVFVFERESNFGKNENKEEKKAGWGVRFYIYIYIILKCLSSNVVYL